MTDRPLALRDRRDAPIARVTSRHAVERHKRDECHALSRHVTLPLLCGRAAPLGAVATSSPGRANEEPARSPSPTVSGRRLAPLARLGRTQPSRRRSAASDSGPARSRGATEEFTMLPRALPDVAVMPILRAFPLTD